MEEWEETENGRLLRGTEFVKTSEEIGVDIQLRDVVEQAYKETEQLWRSQQDPLKSLGSLFASWHDAIESDDRGEITVLMSSMDPEAAFFNFERHLSNLRVIPKAMQEKVTRLLDPIDQRLTGTVDSLGDAVASAFARRPGDSEQLTSQHIAAHSRSIKNSLTSVNMSLVANDLTKKLSGHFMRAIFAGLDEMTRTEERREQAKKRAEQTQSSTTQNALHDSAASRPKDWDAASDKTDLVTDQELFEDIKLDIDLKVPPVSESCTGFGNGKGKIDYLFSLRCDENTYFKNAFGARPEHSSLKVSDFIDLNEDRYRLSSQDQAEPSCPRQHDRS